MGQLDSKFILTILEVSKSRLIVAFDQHAVDERIRVEKLMNGNSSMSLFQGKTAQPRHAIGCNSRAQTPSPPKAKIRVFFKNFSGEDLRTSFEAIEAK